MVNKAMVREAMVPHKEGRLSCSSRERSKADGKSLNSIVKNPKYKKKTSNLCNLHPALLSVSLGELMSLRLAPGVIYT